MKPCTANGCRRTTTTKVIIFGAERSLCSEHLTNVALWVVGRQPED